MIFAGFVVWLRRRCHLLDSLFGDDSCRWGVKDLLKALQLEPVHSAGIGGGQEMMFSSAKSLLLSLSRLPLPVTCCYITELSLMSKSQQLDGWSCFMASSLHQMTPPPSTILISARLAEAGRVKFNGSRVKFVKVVPPAANQWTNIQVMRHTFMPNLCPCVSNLQWTLHSSLGCRD